MISAPTPFRYRSKSDDPQAWFHSGLAPQVTQNVADLMGSDVCMCLVMIFFIHREISMEVAQPAKQTLQSERLL